MRYRTPSRRRSRVGCGLVVLLAALLPATAAGVTTPEAAAHSPAARALAEAPRWQRLLAYEPRATRPGLSGAVHSPGFYLSEAGHEAPLEELQATVAALFAPVVPGAEGAHAACRYPARRRLLVRELGLDALALPLPRPACRTYRDWRERVDAERIVLVYADAYMGNPASMFGHTLLRLDGEDGRRHPLTAFAVNHAAQTQEESGVTFAIRGVLGGYPGQYALMPYHRKVREYVRINSRDLWEYELRLDEAAIDRLLAHLWELRGAAMPYYFFYQNCSFRLLALLEAAEPQLSLRRRFALWALPSDTVRAVVDAGLVSDIHYRPSRRRVLDHALDSLDPADARRARRLALGELAVDAPALQRLPAERRAHILDTAYAYLDYAASRGAAGGDSRQRRHRLLAARSRLDAPRLPEPQRPPVRPDEGHPTGRLGAGLGRLAGVGYAELRWRAAYHDLLDPPAGYLAGAQVDFLEIAARLYRDERAEAGREPEGGAALERLRLIELRSLGVRNQPFPEWAWGVHAGLQRHRAANGDRPLMAELAGDVGPAWTLDEDAAWRLQLAGAAALRASPQLEDRARLGTGLRGELHYRRGPLGLRLTGKGLRFHDDRSAWRLRAEAALSLGQEAAVRLHAERREDFGVLVDSAGLTLYRYF